jgi:hypothetical protein
MAEKNNTSTIFCVPSLSGHVVSAQVQVSVTRLFVERRLSRRQSMGPEGWRFWFAALSR